MARLRRVQTASGFVRPLVLVAPCGGGLLRCRRLPARGRLPVVGTATTAQRHDSRCRDGSPRAPARAGRRTRAVAWEGALHEPSPLRGVDGGPGRKKKWSSSTPGLTPTFCPECLHGVSVVPFSGLGARSRTQQVSSALSATTSSGERDHLLSLLVAASAVGRLTLLPDGGNDSSRCCRKETL